MNATIIPQLIWKDLRLNRSAAIVPLAGGAIGIAMFLRGGMVAVFGAVAFFTAMILSARRFSRACVCSGERKHKTLAFMMSLPLSSTQYTIGKMVTVLGIFLVPWLALVISGVLLILNRAEVPKGLLPLFLALCLLVLAGMCVISCVGLVIGIRRRTRHCRRGRECLLWPCLDLDDRDQREYPEPAYGVRSRCGIRPSCR